MRLSLPSHDGTGRLSQDANGTATGKQQLYEMCLRAKMGRVPKGSQNHWDKFEWRPLNTQTCAARNSLRATHEETTERTQPLASAQRKRHGPGPRLDSTRFRPARGLKQLGRYGRLHEQFDVQRRVLVHAVRLAVDCDQ